MNEDLDIPRLERRLEALEAGPEDPSARAEALAELGWAIGLADTPRSRRLSQQALELAEQLGEARTRGLALRNLGYCALIGGEVRRAIEINLEAEAQLRTVGDDEAVGTVLDSLSHCYERVGDHARGLSAAERGLEINQRIGHARGEAWSFTNLGSLHSDMGAHDSGLEHYRAALERFERIDYPVGTSRVLALIGVLFQKTGRYEEALEHHARAQVVLRELGVEIGAVIAEADMGRALAALGRVDEARERYALAISSYEALGENRPALAETRLCVAELELEAGDLSAARGHLEGALRTLEGSGARRVELDVFGAMARLCEAEEDLAGALDYTRRHHALHMEVFDAESRAAVHDLEVRVELERAEKDAEIHRLRYIELAEMQSRLLHSERLAALGGLASGLAHEINNPLGVIRSNTDVTRRAAARLQDYLPDDAPRRARAALDALGSAAKVSEEAARRIQALAQSLARFTNLDEAEYRDVDLLEGLDSALTLLGPKVPAEVTIERDLQPIPRVRGHGSELNQVFMTLLVNAVEAIEGPGEIRVASAVVGDEVRIEIRDTGRGMPEAQLATLFELGFSDRGGRVRFHLGLPTAAATLEKHGGRLEVSSAVGEGTQFTLHLPAAAR